MFIPSRLVGGHASNLEVTLHPAKWRDRLRAETSFANGSVATVDIVTTRPLDHETEPRLQVRLVASNPVTKESTSTKVDIFVKNENDNTPVFKHRIYNLRTPKGTRRFSSIGRVKAVDLDGDSVTYHQPRQSPPFVVVPQTGEVLVTETPHLAMYLLQVVAKDSGTPQRTSKPALGYRY